jgi:putative hydrolase of the HAD superfamily
MAHSVLIFDLDDTLYPELDYILGGFRAAAWAVEERCGWPADQTYRELEQIFLSAPGAAVFDRWLERRGQDRAKGHVRDLMLCAYRAHRPKLRLFADAAWALDMLGAEYRLALLTDGRSESQRDKIRALGLHDTFREVLVTDELGLSWRKPSPRGFELLLARLGGRRPEDAVYVADNPAKDFLAPNLLGMPSVRVRRPCGRHHALEALTPEGAAQAEITSLFELPALLPDLYQRCSHEPVRSVL